MSDFAHLVPEAAHAMALPTPRRIAFCEADRWIGYERAQKILAQLDDLMERAKALRMPNMLIVGRSGNGKSSILDRFANRHPLLMRDNGTPDLTVVRITMPSLPKEGNFWSAILWELNIAHRERDPPERKQRQAIEMLQFVGARIVAIDEFNHLTNAGKDAARLLAAIKNLSSDLRVPIVAAGTEAAIHALGSDRQMSSRFTPAPLDRWQLNTAYLSLLASYERILPLAEPSNLASRELAPMLYAMGGDTVGGTVNLLKAAARQAIASGRERIDAALLKSLDYTTPGQWDTIARRV